MASYQYVYVMKDVTKNFPGGREVFKGITLSFLPGGEVLGDVLHDIDVLVAGHGAGSWRRVSRRV